MKKERCLPYSYALSPTRYRGSPLSEGACQATLRENELYLNHFTQKIQNKPQNKTIHPQIEHLLCAEITFAAQSRHPRGTSAEPLNAAWFPI